jgi:glycosyltransferase involved in cell wall biosynthesis
VRTKLGAVAVGVPVRNGDPTLVDALASVLTQADADVAVVVSDNFSTDSTAAAMEELAARDERVTVCRPPDPLAAPDNFRFAFECARDLGLPYFCWLAADDAMCEGYLRSAAALLEEGSAHFVVSDAEFVSAGTMAHLSTWQPSEHLSSPDTFRRLLGYATQPRWNEIYSLYDRTTFDVLAEIRDGYGFDALLTWKLLLRGPAARLHTVGTRYAVRSDGPTERGARVRYKLRRARDGKPPQWFGLWFRLWRATAGAPTPGVRSRARAVLLLAAVHPNWLKKFAEETFRRAVRMATWPVRR